MITKNYTIIILIYFISNQSIFNSLDQSKNNFLLNHKVSLFTDDQIQETELASFVCGTYMNSLSNEDPIKYFDQAILKRLKFDINHPDRKKIVGKFLNDNHDILICERNMSGDLRESESLIKRGIGRGEYGLINNLMFFEEDYNYNLNHYEIVNGKKETILDYIEKILNSPDLLSKYDADGLKVLHNDLIEYEAKRGSEL